MAARERANKVTNLAPGSFFVPDPNHNERPGWKQRARRVNVVLRGEMHHMETRVPACCAQEKLLRIANSQSFQSQTLIESFGSISKDS